MISRMHQVQNAARVAMGDSVAMAQNEPPARDFASITGYSLVGGVAVLLAAVVLFL